MDYAGMAKAKLEARDRLAAMAQTITDDSKLTNAEKRERIENVNADIAVLTDEARSFVEQGEREREVRNMAGGSKLFAPAGSAGPEVRMDEALPAGKGFADLAGVRAKSAAEFGEFARSIAFGESRGQNEGTDAKGGFIVPVEYSAGILDLARSRTQVVKAGAQIVPLSTDTKKIAKLTGEPSPEWRNEAALIASGDLSFGEVTFTARSMAVMGKASWELIEDAANFGSVLQNSFAQAFALKLDAAALYGTGNAPEPLGLKGTPGVTITPVAANGAALTTWDPLVGAVSRVRSANYEPSAILYSERTSATVGSFKDSAGQYLAAPEYLKDIQRLSTNQIPTNLTVGTSGATTSDVFTGDFSQLMIGVRTSFRLKVLQERFADTGEVGFVGWLRADVQVARADAFQVVTGIKP